MADVSRLCGANPCPDARARRDRHHGHLPVHKAAGVREAIEAAGAYLLYLPSYSPDLNPIEMAFSKLKALLRKAAERTIPKLISLIGRILKKFSPEECRNFLSHAGYVC
jgi:transposase